MSMNLAQVEASAKRLFPDLSVEQVLAELLLERAQKNLLKCQSMARQFEVKYKQDFTAFRAQVLSSRPASEVEQDYFDWELAVTGVTDMAEEIQRLTSLG